MNGIDKYELLISFEYFIILLIKYIYIYINNYISITYLIFNYYLIILY